MNWRTWGAWSSPMKLFERLRYLRRVQKRRRSIEMSRLELRLSALSAGRLSSMLPTKAMRLFCRLSDLIVGGSEFFALHRLVVWHLSLVRNERD